MVAEIPTAGIRRHTFDSFKMIGKIIAYPYRNGYFKSISSRIGGRGQGLGFKSLEGNFTHIHT